MIDHATWSLPFSLIVFLGAACAIAFGGVRLTRRAEDVARVSGLGELLTGALLIGAVTSLAGLVTSVAAALDGRASIAVSNSLGGIAAQTVFLAVADMAYRRANLEHAAASVENLLQVALLIALLALAAFAMAVPQPAVFGVHPVSLLLICAYVFGLRLIRDARQHPMWHPRQTKETNAEHTGGETRTRRGSLYTSFAALAVIVAVSGWALANAGMSIADHLEISDSLVGGVLTAVTTSLPELVVAVTAVRRGALGIAVGDILGGNAFDVLFLSASDIAYRNGSIFAAVSSRELAWVALTILLVGVLLLGLLRREKHGVANIGFESALVLALYAGGLLMLMLA